MLKAIAEVSPEDWDLLVPNTYIDRQPTHKEIKFHLIVGGDEELVEMVEIINKKLMAAEYETTRTQFPGVDHGAIVILPLPELSGVIEDAQHP